MIDCWNKLFCAIKDHISRIEQHIDEWYDAQWQDMEKWKEEDPEAYYDFMFTQFNGKR